jgi:hypothetical protein
MTTSEPPRGDASVELPWARASLRVSSRLADREDFEGVVSRLENVTGKVTLNTRGDRRIWIDECPLASDANAEDQLAWAVEEAEAVLGRASVDLADCSVELWLGLAVGAQLGVVYDAASLRRLATLPIDLVLDLYGWD